MNEEETKKNNQLVSFRCVMFILSRLCWSYICACTPWSSLFAFVPLGWRSPRFSTEGEGSFRTASLSLCEGRYSRNHGGRTSSSFLTCAPLPRPMSMLVRSSNESQEIARMSTYFSAYSFIHFSVILLPLLTMVTLSSASSTSIDFWDLYGLSLETPTTTRPSPTSQSWDLNSSQFCHLVNPRD